MVELGNKHECPGCEAKFYDLGQDPAICPKCGVDMATGKVPEEPAPEPEADEAGTEPGEGEE